MPQKWGEDTLQQIALKLVIYLMENEGSHTLSKLSEKFNISKQSISRTLRLPELLYFGEIIEEKQGKEKCYRLDKSRFLNRLLRWTPKKEGLGKSFSYRQSLSEGIMQEKKSLEAALNSLVLPVLAWLEANCIKLGLSL